MRKIWHNEAWEEYIELGEEIKKRVAAFLTEKMKEMNGNKDVLSFFRY